MGSLRGLVIGVVVGFALATAQSCGETAAKECGADNCANGCCDASGACRTALSEAVCGTGGAACAACAAGQSCASGVCSGGGTTDAGADAGGDAGEEEDAGTQDAGSDAGTDGGSDGGMTLDAFCADRIPAICDFYARCGMAVSGELCEDFFAGLFGGADLCRDVRAAAADGRVTFHASRAQACVDTIRSTIACSAFEDPDAIPECLNFVSGNVPRNGACYMDAECAATDYCSADLACPGTCEARNGVGASVSRTPECQAGLYAYFGPSGATCQAFAQPGSSCAELELAGDPQTCTAGYFCDPDTLTCLARNGPGGSCAGPFTFDTGCQAHLQCIGGTCQPWVGSGGACGYIESRCQIGLACNTSTPFGTGSCAGLKGLGGSCWSTDECSSGLFCDGVNLASFPPTRGACANLKASGSICREEGECQPGLFCAGTNGGANAGGCAPQKAEGATCAGDEIEECEQDLFCDNGSCVAGYCRDATP